MEPVLLAQLHALGPPATALVEVSGNAPELDQLVLLQPLRQGDVVKVVVGIDRCSQTLGGHSLLWVRDWVELPPRNQ